MAISQRYRFWVKLLLSITLCQFKIIRVTKNDKIGDFDFFREVNQSFL